PTVSDCLNAFDPSADYYPIEQQIQPSNDTGFTVSYQKYYKIVNNTRTNEVFILYCSASVPIVSNVPNAKYFQVPVKNVASLDLPTVTFLELMNVHSSLKYVDNTLNITSPCLQKNIADNTLQNFNWNVTNVDIVFLDATQTNNNTNKTVIVNLGDDITPLQKLEWIKFFSLFFDKEAAVKHTIDQLLYVYGCDSKNLVNIPIADRKTIAWVSFDSNVFEVKHDTYHVALIKDAGAYPIVNSSSIVKSTDDLHLIINNATIVIDESPSIASFDTWQRKFGYYPEQNSRDIPDFITHRRVYRVNRFVNYNGYFDWSESAAARPDIALKDLIAIQYPTYEPSYDTRWFHQFSDPSTVLTSNNCVDPNQPQSFLTCRAKNFTGDSSPIGDGSNNKDKSDSTRKLSPLAETLIITFSILA
ncbi:31284_t:CDS:2, partial [Racocetra persica]